MPLTNPVATYIPTESWTQDSAPYTWAELIELARHWEGLDPDGGPLLPLRDSAGQVFDANGDQVATRVEAACS